MKKLIPVLALSLLFSCSEDIQESFEGEVLFDAQSLANGNPLKFEAGIYGYYMSTGPITDPKFGDSGLVIFTGVFEDVVNPANAEKLRFKIGNHQTGIPTSQDVDFVLSTGTIPYHQSTQNSFVVSFSPQGKSFTEYTWDFGDGTTSTEAAPTKIYNNALIDRYYVCLTVSDGQGCTDQICSDVFMPNALCTAQIDSIQIVSRVSTNEAYFTANVTGNGTFNYEWTFENGVTANSKEVKYSYNRNDSLIEHARLKVTDDWGCESEVARKVKIGDFPGDCFINFTNSVPVADSTQKVGFSSVEIEYIDANGTVFSSFNGPQGTEAYFNITDFTDYIPNAFGNQTKAINVEYNCLLYDDQGNTMHLTDGKARIAIGY